MALTYEFVQIAGPHPRGERLRLGHSAIVAPRPNCRFATHKESLILRRGVQRGAVLTQSSLRELRSYYRALGDVNRLRIVQILVTEGEQPVSELARRLRISQPLMSWHLRRLRRAGIVRMERVGREVRCSFDREKFAELNARGFRLLMNRAEAQA
jgi:DNA-binding transcriptional ArsR family regulator